MTTFHVAGSIYKGVRTNFTTPDVVKKFFYDHAPGGLVVCQMHQNLFFTIPDFHKYIIYDHFFVADSMCKFFRTYVNQHQTLEKHFL
jgi:hypothetical protein